MGSRLVIMGRGMGERALIDVILNVGMVGVVRKNVKLGSEMCV